MVKPEGIRFLITAPWLTLVIGLSQKLAVVVGTISQCTLAYIVIYNISVIITTFMVFVCRIFSFFSGQYLVTHLLRLHFHTLFLPSASTLCSSFSLVLTTPITNFKIVSHVFD